MPRSPGVKRILVTGSLGLVGSAVCSLFSDEGYAVHGVDSNQRAVFFGHEGDTSWNLRRLQSTIHGYVHHHLDVRDRRAIVDLVATHRPDVVVHAAAQPSHDLAAAIPFDDFDTNATGTLNLLEAARRHCPDSPFVFLSTNKVYGDSPNRIPIRECETRWEFDDPAYENGIGEGTPVDQSLHSLFGASKLAADILVQEYGRYFGLPTCCLRAGCITGPGHSGVPLHGFLSYLVKANVTGTPYQVFGYRGKQVRDNIDADDVAQFVREFAMSPRRAEVYNLGGGKENSCSILEAFGIVEGFTGRAQQYEYLEEHRVGDHRCYYSDLRKAKRDYPAWTVRRPLRSLVSDIVASWEERLQ